MKGECFGSRPGEPTALSHDPSTRRQKGELVRCASGQLREYKTCASTMVASAAAPGQRAAAGMFSKHVAAARRRHDFHGKASDAGSESMQEHAIVPGRRTGRRPPDVSARDQRESANALDAAYTRRTNIPRDGCSVSRPRGGPFYGWITWPIAMEPVRRGIAHSWLFAQADTWCGSSDKKRWRCTRAPRRAFDGCGASRAGVRS